MADKKKKSMSKLRLHLDRVLKHSIYSATTNKVKCGLCLTGDYTK